MGDMEPNRYKAALGRLNRWWRWRMSVGELLFWGFAFTVALMWLLEAPHAA